jgi:hypothetical protein
LRKGKKKRRSERLFVSYARADASELAFRLHRDLGVAGYDSWLDTRRIRGGTSWTTEIERAIDGADVVLALLSPRSYSSEICRAEQLRSLRKQKCVIPILVTGQSDRPLHLESKHYLDFSSERSYRTSFRALLATIRARNGAALPTNYRVTPAVYITAPPRVINYIHRPEAILALRDVLFSEGDSRSVALTALEGMGGIGKTVLAQALFRDEVVREAFPDGLAWITVGRESDHDVTSQLREIITVLGGTIDGTVSIDTLYRTTLFGKAALIVIDDIWSKADLDPFLAESPRSRFLFTTRDSSIARFSGAREFRLSLLDKPQARKLLALWAGLAVQDLPTPSEDIVHECALLPLALSTIGALLRGATPAEWMDVVELLRHADLAAIQGRLPPGQQSFFRAIDVSVKALPRDVQQKYAKLAVIPEDYSAPLAVLRTVWNLAEVEARAMARLLASRSLAEQEGEDSIRLHDLQLDYVRAQHSDMAGLNLIRGAVRLSANVIEKEPLQFASQVVGRLLPHKSVAVIKQFSQEIAEAAPRPWLRPLWPGLDPPGMGLIRTLVGHSSIVRAVVVTPDGQCAVSGSDDETTKLWDLRTGRLLRTLVGHDHHVNGVAVTPRWKKNCYSIRRQDTKGVGPGEWMCNHDPGASRISGFVSCCYAGWQQGCLWIVRQHGQNLGSNHRTLTAGFERPF